MTAAHYRARRHSGSDPGFDGEPYAFTLRQPIPSDPAPALEHDPIGLNRMMRCISVLTRFLHANRIHFAGGEAL
jgi:hypothetical protein